ARRADLAAEHARVLAVTDARDEDRRPDAFDARLEERRMERVVRTHLHALRTANASLEELSLFDSPRRTNHLRVIIHVERIRDARHRQEQSARACSGETRSAIGVGLHDRALAVRQEAELDDVLGAGVLAVEAHVALVL